MKRIVVATKNPGKIREMTAAFRELPVELVALASFGRLPDAVEDGETFAANAEIKARFYMQATGVACLADDSGLEVEALGGAPGVYSARFAGYHADDAANNAKLLDELTRAGRAQSAAAYRCALAFVDTNERLLLASGSCQGTVKKEPRGVGGFGYDPYFYIEENKTMAELTLQEKDKISHRGNALREMAKLLNVYLSGRN